MGERNMLRSKAECIIKVSFHYESGRENHKLQITNIKHNNQKSKSQTPMIMIQMSRFGHWYLRFGYCLTCDELRSSRYLVLVI